MLVAVMMGVMVAVVVVERVLETVAPPRRGEDHVRRSGRDSWLDPVRGLADPSYDGGGVGGGVEGGCAQGRARLAVERERVEIGPDRNGQLPFPWMFASVDIGKLLSRDLESSRSNDAGTLGSTRRGTLTGSDSFVRSSCGFKFRPAAAVNSRAAARNHA
ncbi:hypothetical protein HZU67_03305 [Apis mellifera carnica]|nr:hypothetical protein HZU67_03305 [Apis mellifera carnica]